MNAAAVVKITDKKGVNFINTNNMYGQIKIVYTKI